MSNFLPIADPNCYLERIRNSRDVLPLKRELEETPRLPMNRTGGFAVYEFNLAGTANGSEDITQGGGVLISSPGFGFLVLAEGSAPGARLDIDAGGLVPRVGPGQGFRGYFDSIRISRSSSSVASGTVRVLVALSPNVDWRELPVSSQVSAGAASVSNVAQTYNSAAGNQPSLATAGLPLIGARGARLTLDAGLGNTFSTGVGNVVLWYYSPDQAAWCEGRTVLAIPSNSLRRVAFDDLIVAVPYGRIYAEVRSATHSGGAGAINSYLEVL